MWDRNRRNMLGTVDDMPQYRKYMTQALELAHKGAGWVNPNPLVGTVVVRDGEILAAGYHDRYRGPHAERMAFDYADEHGVDMHGATVIDTLEPCCHVGSQPACTDLILSHGITRVVVGSIDPNPIVAGNLPATTNASEMVEKVVDNASDGAFLEWESQALTDAPHFMITWTPNHVSSSSQPMLDGMQQYFNGSIDMGTFIDEMKALPTE